jgi:biofilm PGA synthesis N-glycosyltransferase PgaC
MRWDEYLFLENRNGGQGLRYTHVDEHRKYVVITAARNERRYIQRTLESVVEQTLEPLRWVIVSDGSTDGTDEVVRQYAESHDFIRLIQIAPKNTRSFGSKARAVKIGEDSLCELDFEYIANVDGDVSFSRDYFERVFDHMEKDPSLGIGGGVLVEPYDGRWIRQTSNTQWSVSGPIQVFRRECFIEIGGYLPLAMGGVDTMAEVIARMKGWGVRAFPDVEAYHHRRTGGYVSGLQAAYRLGAQEYLYGSHLVFEMLKCLKRIVDRPWFVMSTMRMAGYLWYLVRGKAKAVPDDIVRFVRREQILRIARPLGDPHSPR